MKILKTYLAFLENSVDKVLDTMNKNRKKEPTPFEEYVLTANNPNADIEEFIVDWLNMNYSDLSKKTTSAYNIGMGIDNIIMFNKTYMDRDDRPDTATVFKYFVDDRQLRISVYFLPRELGDYYDGETIKKWFQEAYGYQVATTGLFR